MSSNNESLVTSLFVQDYGDDIIISDQDDIIRLINIQRYVLIAKLPGYTNKMFYQFLQSHLEEKDYTYSLEDIIQLYDGNVSTLNQPWTYFKVYSSKQQLLQLIRHKESTISDISKCKQTEYNKRYLEFANDNYLVPDIIPKKQIIQVHPFYYTYYNTLQSIKQSKEFKQLPLEDQLIVESLRYPFRQTDQSYLGIQYKYNINLFKTFKYNLKKIVKQVNNPEKYNAKRVFYIDIKDISQADEQTQDTEMQKFMENSLSLMFDIENYVLITEKDNPNAKKPTFNTLLQSKKQFSELSNYYFKQYTTQSANNTKFCDQQQIICISFIEQNFKSQLKKKLAVLNLPISDEELSKIDINQLKDQINNSFSDEQDPQKNQYVDELFVYNSERELLIKTIQILSNPKYKIIQHFNGWKFDEQMLSIRYLTHNLFDLYVKSVLPIRTLNINQIEQQLTYNSTYKQSASSIESELTQIKSPLKFSLDVYQLNLHDDVNAQKHDGGNSLNALLQYHNLGLKGDISYQEISDAFEQKDIPTLIKTVWYCQRDSIQQARLQKKLRIILNNIQFSILCQISLKDSIQKAVGTKVLSTVYQYYHQNKVAIQDQLLTFQMPQTIQTIVSGKAKETKLTNIGGEVVCFKPGFNKCISAVDAASMYPAQVEANNVSNNCMLLPYQMDLVVQYLLNLPTKGSSQSKSSDESSNESSEGSSSGDRSKNIQRNVKFTYILDLYSPYTDEKFPLATEYLTKLLESIPKEDINIINLMNFENHNKQYRLKIDITYKDQQLSYEQFYFVKKDMQQKYNFVFYLQGKQPTLGQPFSPRSSLLTSFRFLRKGVKKQIKEAQAAGDQDLADFLDGKQGAIKICMNSLYGTTDTTNYVLFENIGASIITRCSKCEIRNCRDNIQQTHLLIQPRHKIQELTDSIKQYNCFVLLCFKEQYAKQLIIRRTPNCDQILIPKLLMKYQDTDSNYFIIQVLDEAEVKDQFQVGDQIIYTSPKGPISDDSESSSSGNSSEESSSDSSQKGSSKEQSKNYQIIEEQYIKSHLFGLFNDIFSRYINNSMNKFPLEFDFEGAFYKAWHIGKKQYLGQKIPQFCLDLKFSQTENGGFQLTSMQISPGVHISNEVQLEDYNPDTDDIYKFIKDRHLKITGIKVVKRDTNLLTKQYYMKFVQKLLNCQDYHSQNAMTDLIVQLLNELKDDFVNHKIKLKYIVKKKKITSADLTNNNMLISYNNQHPDKRLGLGQQMYFYIRTLEEQSPLIFQQSTFQVQSHQQIVPEEYLDQSPNNIYTGYYILQVAKSLVSFEMLYEGQEDEENDPNILTKASNLIKDNNIIYSKINTLKVTKNNINQCYDIIQELFNTHQITPKMTQIYKIIEDSQGKKQYYKIILDTFIKNLEKQQKTKQQEQILQRFIQLTRKK